MPRRLRWRPGLAAALLLLGCAAGAAAQPRDRSPAQLFQELYARVEMEQLFPDSKTFADMVPLREPAAILADYRSRHYSRSELAAFVGRNFMLPAQPKAQAVTSLPPLRERIRQLWPQLIRPPLSPAPWSSALAFSRSYVVPGGRFREIYYWDSYFTLLGMGRDGYHDVVAGMVAGFAELIDRYGHIPNGTRTYYLSRSQPPLFYRMVGLLDTDHPETAYARYLPELKAEYGWWMQGVEGLAPGGAAGHVVMMPDGGVLNRYWDALATPRDESYREDVLLARQSGRPAAEVYRDIRAAAESGWDFSSRWLADGVHLATIHTTDLVPADLNSLLYGLELAIAQGCGARQDAACAGEFTDRAARRQAEVSRYLWDEKRGGYRDYDRRKGAWSGPLSAATLYPLFTRLADDARAQAVAKAVRTQLLAPGGLLTTGRRTGQQWDAPNGWAPLQWIAVEGLRAYGQHCLARELARRWLQTVQRTYAAEGRLVEKYDVERNAPGGGGEYPLQDGFGWTNGVTATMLDLYGQADAADASCAQKENDAS